MAQKPLKILQIGQFGFVSNAINAALLRAGHKALICAELPQLNKTDYDLILFESVAPICGLFSDAQNSKAHAYLQNLKDRGSALYLYLYAQDQALLDFFKQQSQQSILVLQEYFDQIFFSSSAALPLAGSGKNAGWLAAPLDLALIPKPKIEEPPAQQIKIIFLKQDGHDTLNEQALQIFNSLQNKKFKFDFELLNLDKIRGVSELIDQLQKCHILIEALNLDNYGAFGALGLALGKTVLSGKRKDMYRYWNQLEFSPVLDTDIESLPRRLESILREPKCLRDLSKRGREFAEKNHNSDVIVKLLLAKF